MKWLRAIAIGLALFAGFFLGSGAQPSAQPPFLMVGSSSTTGTSQVIKSTSNALWVSLQSVASPLLFPDGNSGAPSIAFASEPTLGFFRSGAGIIMAQTVNSFNTSAAIFSGSDVRAAASNAFYWTGRSLLKSPADGLVNVLNQASTVGAQFKVDALPTVASGFGTSPVITAGSTPLAGSINVGTGAPGTGGVINWNGTAFPSAPFVICEDQTTLLTVRCTATTTQLTIAATALTASDVVTWIAISSK